MPLEYFFNRNVFKGGLGGVNTEKNEKSAFYRMQNGCI
jgi:hypothetical protein